LVDGIVRADQKIRADAFELIRGAEHEFRDSGPIAAVDALHVLAKGIRVYRHLRVSVRTQQLPTLDANRFVAKRGALGGASDDADVQRHEKSS
jgi:hypothetical protein